MGKRKVEVSINEEIRNIGKAMAQVTRAALSGAPGTATRLGGKRKTAQFTFRVKDTKEKQQLSSAARKRVLDIAFSRRAVEIENSIRKALEAVIVGLVGVQPQNIKVMGRSIGNASPHVDLENEGFARYIKSKAGAGEVGLPDPDESLRNLKIALVRCITVDVVVRKNGPQAKFSFDQRRLLSLTPHPDRFEGGGVAEFFSWLSLVTGPDFLSGGTPGFAMVRASDLKAVIRKRAVRAQTFTSKGARATGMTRARKVGSLLQVSRTRGYAGDLSAIMMDRVRAAKLVGISEQWSPKPKYVGYWDSYWFKMKNDLAMWTKRVMFAAVRGVFRK